MLYIIYGDNIGKRQAKVSELRAERDTEVFSVGNFTEGKLEELLATTGLFSEQKIIILRDFFTTATTKQWLLSAQKLLVASPHVVILLEDLLAKVELKKWEKISHIFAFEQVRIIGADFNSFSLTDAVGRRDKKQAWLLYQQALRHGKEPEEIHGLVFWIFKTMLLVANGKDHGLKPFVASKAAGFARNYSVAELKKTSGNLIDIYHQSRRIGAPLGLAMEKFLLTI